MSSARRLESFSEEKSVAQEDAQRAGVYGLLAALLREPPTEEMFAVLRGLETDDGGDAMAQAWALLRLAARHSDSASADDEFHALFIGVVSGELLPYASWYLTGFLMERPLSELRDDLVRLGFAREEGVGEPEDHAAALCEVMSLLAADGDAESGTARQAAFFGRHMAPWIERFFGDLETAQNAVFYRAVGRLGNAFMALERRYLDVGP
ncbi:TorD/DmsD family molecular chaperone [Acidihalobacter prosperus]